MLRCGYRRVLVATMGMFGVLLVLPYVTSAFWLNVGLVHWTKTSQLEAVGILPLLLNIFEDGEGVYPISERTLAELDNALKWNAHSLNGQYHRNVAVLVNGQYEEAAIQARDLQTQGYDRFGQVSLALGVAYHQMNDKAAAYAAWRATPDNSLILERFGTVGACQAATLLNPESSDAFYCLGSALAQSGDLASAEVAWKQAIELNNSRYPPKRAAYDNTYSRPQAFYRIGLMYFEQGRWQEAQRYFEQALETDPDHYWTILFHPLTQYRLDGDVAAAISALESVVECHPQHANAMHQLAKLYLVLPDNAKALEWAERAVMISPQYAEGYLVRGLAQMALGEPEKALVDFQIVISRREYLEEAYANAARAALALEDHAQAISYATQALTYSANDPDLLLLLGDAYCADGDLARAARAYALALEVAPDRSDIKERLELVNRE
jgi:tetratricopeptide (TPR) repeat protein